MACKGTTGVMQLNSRLCRPHCTATLLASVPWRRPGGCRPAARETPQGPHTARFLRSEPAGNTRPRNAPWATQSPGPPGAGARRAPGACASKVRGAPRGNFQSYKLSRGASLPPLTNVVQEAPKDNTGPRWPTAGHAGWHSCSQLFDMTLHGTSAVKRQQARPRRRAEAEPEYII